MNCCMSPCRSDYILACYASPLCFGCACSLLYSVHADKSASLSIVVTGSIVIIGYHYCFPRYCLLREFHRLKRVFLSGGIRTSTTTDNIASNHVANIKDVNRPNLPISISISLNRLKMRVYPILQHIVKALEHLH